MRRPMTWGVIGALALGAWCAVAPFEASADLLLAAPANGYLARSILTNGNNTWQKIPDADGLVDPAMTAPGANDTAGGADRPWLVYRMPAEVPAAESTASGKTWQIWLHMRVPADKNSFYFQTSTDANTWLPADINNACRVNDDGDVNTDVWKWQDQRTGNDGAVDPIVSAGINYVRIGSREANPDAATSPRFDVVVLKNFGPLGDPGAPDDADVLTFIEATAVEPNGKLATMWADVKTVR